MNLAEWILVMFLSIALLIFLIVGIIFLVKFTSLLSEIEIMVQTGQSIFDKADDVADNIKDLTSVGPLAKGFVKEYIGRKLFGLLRVDRKPKKSVFDEFEEEEELKRPARSTKASTKKTRTKSRTQPLYCLLKIIYNQSTKQEYKYEKR